MYNMPIVAPRPGILDRLIGGFTQGVDIGNTLQQAHLERQKQLLQAQLQPIKMQELSAMAKLYDTKSQLLPQQLDVSKGRLALDQKINSPEQLASRLASRQAMTQNAPMRFLSPLGKEIVEQQNLQKGLGPSGAVGAPMQMTPQEKQLASNQYDLSRIKKTTDAKIRNSLVQATSIDNTFDTIPFNEISQYFGVNGRILAAKEAANVAAGQSPSPSYQKYLNFLNIQGPGLAGQMRQFLQDSVQKGAQEKLKSIIFPDKWLSNPDTALAQFNSMKNLYGTEKFARQRAVTDPTIFTGTSAEGALGSGAAQASGQPISKQTQGQQGSSSQSSQVIDAGVVRIRAPDGAIGTVPASQADAFLTSNPSYSRIDNGT